MGMCMNDNLAMRWTKGLGAETLRPLVHGERIIDGEMTDYLPHTGEPCRFFNEQGGRNGADCLGF